MSIGLPDIARQVKAFFAAVPQIEHNWTTNRPGIPKTKDHVGATNPRARQ
jgi:hypothetical protein